MKHGIFTWFGYLLPYEDRLKLIRDAGFDCITTWWTNMFSDSDGKREDHVSSADKMGLFIDSVHLEYAKSDELWMDGVAAEEVFNRLCLDIESAGQHNMRVAIIHPYVNCKICSMGVMELFERRIHKMCDLAQSSGINLAFENLAGSNAAIDIIMRLRKDDSNTGLCFDTGHNNIVPPRDFSILEKYGKRIFALHIHDNDGITDEHKLPFEGCIDWEKFITALNNTGYEGSLMLESSHQWEKADGITADGYLRAEKKTLNILDDMRG